MIIEGMLTCRDGERPHVSAIGPVVNEALTDWILRPYHSSRMYELLKDCGTCVFHVVDDCLPIVRHVLKMDMPMPLTQIAPEAWILDEACRWYRLEIQTWREDGPRSIATAKLMEQGELRPFWGWNRAKHALLEAAIVISRAGLISERELDDSLNAFRSPIEKTGGAREQEAWQLIEDWRRARRVISPPSECED